MHSHETALLSLQLLRLGLDHQVPLVATCHYLPRFVSQYVGWDGRLDVLAENVVWEYAIRLLNQFDHSVFPSNTQALSFINRGLTAPTTVISNGVNHDYYQPGSLGVDMVEAKYGLPTGRRILFVSRLAKDKRIDVLIRSMVYLERIDTHLIVVGTGDDEPRLREITRSHDLENRVHFLGFVPEEDLPSIYRASDLFAIASECEVQSIPTLQAVATGLPVVAVEAAALPDLVTNGVNGFLAPPGDAKTVAELATQTLGDRDRAAAMGRASFRTSRAHDETATFEAHESLYQRVIAGYVDPAQNPTPRSWSRMVPFRRR